MKLHIIEESLKSSTAYMLRNDGKLFELSEIHPYILPPHIRFNSNVNVIRGAIEIIFDHTVNDINPILWFYNNSANSDFKRDVNCLLYLIYNNVDYFGDYREQIDELHIPLTETYGSIKETIALLCKINADANQEFCRVRTSNIFWGGNNNDIYFRISSINFNWFNIIWELVYRNRDFISNVTIVKDSSKDEGTKYIYNYNGHIFNRMPTKDFLTLSGKPVIESNNSDCDDELLHGKSLKESLGDMNIIRFIQVYDNLAKIDLASNYKKIRKV